jgi:AcrR family transcriptional regulator
MLGVALEAFAELGYDGASTRAIAARAGVNQGMIPYYFGTKEALWREAVGRAFEEVRALMEEARAGGSPLDDRARAEQMIRQVVRFVARRPEFVRVMNDEGKREGPRMEWIVDHLVREVFEVVRDQLYRAGGLARLPADLDPLHLYYILIGAITMLFHQAPECQRLTGRDPSDEEVVEAHADALVALFVGEPPRSSPT